MKNQKTNLNSIKREKGYNQTKPNWEEKSLENASNSRAIGIQSERLDWFNC